MRTDVAVGHLGFGREAGVVSQPGDRSGDESEEIVLDHHPLLSVLIAAGRLLLEFLLLVVVDPIVLLVVVASLVRVFVSVGNERQAALVRLGSVHRAGNSCER